MRNRVLPVMLVVGLQEKPNSSSLPDYKAGGEDKPVAVSYRLGCTVVGPVVQEILTYHRQSYCSRQCS